MIKALVCERQDIVACLAPGDRVQIFSAQPGFRKRHKIPMTVCATFGQGSDEGDYFFVDKGPAIPISDLNRRLEITVLLVVPREDDHSHECRGIEQVGERVLAAS